ncbi:MAG: exodeoxyribonuclease V subunit gamma [Clostridiales bacterium]|nr:exodeoxyribonuclease V subunit gamma [Clostridiales bacterium]
MEFLDKLNEAQRQAVTVPDGAVLVVAGAGSGKTRVLVSRVAWLLTEKRVSPYQIFVTTFTNKAAREMKERLESLTGLDVRRLWLGTFHSLCCRILRMEEEFCPFDANFVIYDDDDCQKLLKQVVISLELNPEKFKAKSMSWRIGELKNKLQTPSDLLESAKDDWDKSVAAIYSEYQKQMRHNNALDFNDLLMEAVRLFEQHPGVLERYRSRFPYILVDEYQDTNHCQYRLIKQLAGSSGNVFVVGDPDQSIYGWRGADITNILDFERDFPSCRVINLTQNYRSSQTILAAANQVISNNTGRLEKDLWTDKGMGQPVISHSAANDRAEALYVMENITKLAAAGRPYSDFAVLYRMHSQSRSLEEQAIKYRIPYRIFAGIKFYERKEIKDSLAYLRLVANPADGISLDRIYNEPRRGIGKTSWDKLTILAAGREQSAYQLLQDPEALADFSFGARSKLLNFGGQIRSWLSFIREHDSVAELLEYIWQSSGYYQMLKNDPEGEDRLENLAQLYNVAAEFDARRLDEEEDEESSGSLVDFLAQVALATDTDDWQEGSGSLTMMSLHAAKGLEFPFVFLVGMEEGIFPHQRSLDSAEPEELEEERRLCYVGMTRAMEQLFLLRSQRRMLWNNLRHYPPSRFLEEIPDHLLSQSGGDPIREAALARQKQEPSFHNMEKFTIQKEQPKAQTAGAMLNIGDKIEHSKFGLGVIISMSGSGDDLEVGVAFPEAGIRKLLWRYAPAKKI